MLFLSALSSLLLLAAPALAYTGCTNLESSCLTAGTDFTVFDDYNKADQIKKELYNFTEGWANLAHEPPNCMGYLLAYLHIPAQDSYTFTLSSSYKGVMYLGTENVYECGANFSDLDPMVSKSGATPLLESTGSVETITLELSEGYYPFQYWFLNPSNTLSNITGHIVNSAGKDMITGGFYIPSSKEETCEVSSSSSSSSSSSVSSASSTTTLSSTASPTTLVISTTGFSNSSVVPGETVSGSLLVSVVTATTDTTELVTITSCGTETCYPVITSTVKEVVTEYTTYCPLTAATSTVSNSSSSFSSSTAASVSVHTGGAIANKSIGAGMIAGVIGTLVLMFSL
ncbi:hypothetical protein DASC09_054320 [Saccharomycopsis crataegensis]|uniref:Uncharacterized protein n=1 Tax=Saccharomycopsis crataegensis TaxID=43959 RepID=A0AAV5QUN3_9ASCO|nr:hypothetical protein DASC09_054320 [Saccharomycopsis crataegensis]